MVFKGKEAIMKVLGRASTQMREDRREVVYPTPKCAMCSPGRGCASTGLSGASPEGTGSFDSSPLQHLKILTMPAATGKVTSCSSCNLVPDWSHRHQWQREGAAGAWFVSVGSRWEMQPGREVVRHSCLWKGRFWDGSSVWCSLLSPVLPPTCFAPSPFSSRPIEAKSRVSTGGWESVLA